MYSNNFVYIFTGTGRKPDGSKDYFIIYGVYSKVTDAIDDMEKHVKSVSSRNLENPVESVIKGIGTQGTVGEMPRYYVCFTDGSRTEYGIQERRLDEKCYE